MTTDAARSYVRYDPLGPILAVMPWNFPFWQVFRFAAPAVMAGNVGLLKHASNVPGTALAIEDAFRRAGFPQGVMTTLLISGQQAEDLIARPEIRAVTLTGSERTGAIVAARAGRHLKRRSSNWAAPIRSWCSPTPTRLAPLGWPWRAAR